jgi:hypothetical protein
MPWLRWIELFSGRRSGSLATNMSLTLVTLEIAPSAEADEVTFYRGAEYEALLDWARMGRFVLALVAEERDELTLLCLQSPEEIRREIAGLPLVSAGLARVDIRRVMSLKMDDPIGSPLH